MRRVFFFVSSGSSTPSRHQNDPPSRGTVVLYLCMAAATAAAIDPQRYRRALCRCVDSLWRAAVNVPWCEARPTTNSTAVTQYVHAVYRARFSTCARFVGRARRRGRRVWPSLPSLFAPPSAADRPRVSKPNTMRPPTQPVGDRGRENRPEPARWPSAGGAAAPSSVPPNPCPARPGRVTK